MKHLAVFFVIGALGLDRILCEHSFDHATAAEDREGLAVYHFSLSAMAVTMWMA